MEPMGAAARHSQACGVKDSDSKGWLGGGRRAYYVNVLRKCAERMRQTRQAPQSIFAATT